MKDTQTLHIKNMVCQRCILAVEKVFKDAGVEVLHVKLGEVGIAGELKNDVKEKMAEDLKKLGFELLEPGTSALISRIKALVVQQIHQTNEPLEVNFSTYLSDRLHQEYSGLSRLFSSVEGITIEKYIIAQKIERVKELLIYDHETLSEIAWQLGYSSVQHLSTQFKKVTGLTPTAFQKSMDKNRKHLDDL